MRISDWSSDVCSSDLRTSEKLLRVADPLIMIALSQVREQRLGDEGIIARALDLAEQIPACAAGIEGIQDDVALGLERHHRRAFGIGDDMPVEIGRASCRERVCQYV